MHNTQSSPVTRHLHRELTLRGIILGALITVVFTASNVYLGLKVGLTFASSIPAAVISMAVLKMFHDSNILENNMVQTQASAAGTLSAVIFVLPGLLMMGYWNGFPFWQTAAVCAAGGILGVIFTIPLRRLMVVDSDLPYPEGVAAAEILKAGDHNRTFESDEAGQQDKTETPENGVRYIIFGGLLAAVFNFLAGGLRIFSDSASYWFKAGASVFQLPMGFSFALLGAGYLVGITGGIAMIAGLLFSWGVAVPFLSATLPAPPDADTASFAMSIWSTKVRYIDAGTIAVAALWTLITLCKPMWEGMKLSYQALRNPGAAGSDTHIDKDLSPKYMFGIAAAMLVILAGTFHHFIGTSGVSPFHAWLLVLCTTVAAFVIGFMVAAACGYMAGLIGSSASPLSGIGIIAVLLISLMLMLVGKATGILSAPGGNTFLTALALFATAVVMAVAAISNDNLQDLKTGFLVHATPARQQTALIIGCVVGAAVIAPVLALLYNAYGFTGALPRADMDPAAALSAPQATLMTTIADGIFSGSLQWNYIITGIALGVAVIMVDAFLKKMKTPRSLPALAVGMGIYLPATVVMPLFVGTLVSYFTARHLHKKQTTDAVQQASGRRGTLFAAGLIVGESLTGVVLAMLIVVSVTSGHSDAPLALNLPGWQAPGQLLGLAAFAAGIFLMVRLITRRD